MSSSPFRPSGSHDRHLSSRSADLRDGRGSLHHHFVGWSRSPLTRSRAVIAAARRRSGGAADELDKLRERGSLTTPLPIRTRELTPPALTTQRRQNVRVGRLLLARVPR